eukprot:8749774-Pyramimonas_sp.AAC.1
MSIYHRGSLPPSCAEGAESKSTVLTPGWRAACWAQRVCQAREVEGFSIAAVTPRLAHSKKRLEENCDN